MFKSKSIIALAAAAMLLSACAQPAPPAAQKPAPAEPTKAPETKPAEPAPAADGMAMLGTDKKFDGITLRAAFIGGGQYGKDVRVDQRLGQQPPGPRSRSCTRAMASRSIRS